MKKYDYLVVGTGLFGATFAYEAAKRGKRVKVIEKRDHIAGNIYTKEVDGIQVHQYGARPACGYWRRSCARCPGVPGSDSKSGRRRGCRRRSGPAARR